MITQQLFNSMTKILTGKFFTTYNQVPATEKQIFGNIVPNDKRAFIDFQTYAGLGQLVEKTQGQQITYDQIQEAYYTRFVFITYALGFRAEKELTEEDPQGLMGRVAQLMAYSSRVTKSRNLWNILNQAFNSSVTGGDGVSLCSASHPMAKAGGNISNIVANTALAHASLQTAILKFRQLKGDDGMPSSQRPVYLCVPIELEQRATEIVGTSRGIPYSADNTVNIHEDRLTVVSDRYLSETSTTAWFVTGNKPGGDQKSSQAEFLPDSHHMVYADRWLDSFETAQDFETKGLKFSDDTRYAWGFIDYRGVVGSQGA